MAREAATASVRRRTSAALRCPAISSESLNRASSDAGGGANAADTYAIAENVSASGAGAVVMVLIFLSFECAYELVHETGDKNPRKYLVENRIPQRSGLTRSVCQGSN